MQDAAVAVTRAQLSRRALAVKHESPFVTRGDAEQWWRDARARIGTLATLGGPESQQRRLAHTRQQPAAMVQTKEAKPPSEVVDAIQRSEDGSTAPPEAEVLRGAGPGRVTAAKLVHEEPQRPSDLPDEQRAATHGAAHDGAPSPGRHPLSAQERQMLSEEARAQHKAPQYDRSHPGAGRAGKGDQAIDSAQGISRDARRE